MPVVITIGGCTGFWLSITSPWLPVIRSLPLALPGVAPVSVASLNERLLPPKTVTVGVPAVVANVNFETGVALRVVARSERPG